MRLAAAANQVGVVRKDCQVILPEDEVRRLLFGLLDQLNAGGFIAMRCGLRVPWQAGRPRGNGGQQDPRRYAFDQIISFHTDLLSVER